MAHEACLPPLGLAFGSQSPCLGLGLGLVTSDCLSGLAELNQVDSDGGNRLGLGMVQ